jgi:hypothetical protein
MTSGSGQPARHGMSRDPDGDGAQTSMHLRRQPAVLGIDEEGQRSWPELIREPARQRGQPPDLLLDLRHISRNERHRAIGGPVFGATERQHSATFPRIDGQPIQGVSRYRHDPPLPQCLDGYRERLRGRIERINGEADHPSIDNRQSAIDN